MDIEKRARELLAIEYGKEGWDTEAANCRNGVSDAVDRFAIGAIVAALTERAFVPGVATLNMIALGPQFGLTLVQTEELWNRMVAICPYPSDGYALVPLKMNNEIEEVINESINYGYSAESLWNLAIHAEQMEVK